jgi:hypothetical protein
MSTNWKKIQGMLPLKHNFEPKDLLQVKYSQEMHNIDGYIDKKQVSFPIYLADGRPFCLVYCMHQFTVSARMMRWQNNGEKLFEAFPTISEDPQNWDLIWSRQETPEVFG